MKPILHSRLFRSAAASVKRSASLLQHLLMRVAVAISLKLCWFAAQFLLNGSARRQAGTL
ncbi:MAG: hypothetical protein AAF716_02595 [Cyanobacteria bacterium P01_D01_bin.1]